ncbi:MAG: hypothetical protein RLZZ450_486 [Pseudomonadota bacterium]|jgi:pSer/pThr/pTyr-binding forkhead associated (FHA) protein
MSERHLIVEVADAEHEARTEYLFAHSPVRVGRSLLNDLALEYGFVSHCHGLFHFDEQRVEFVDVGSTNGSFVNGTRLVTNQRVTLSNPATVTIGALRLLVRLEARRESAAPTWSREPSTQLIERFAQSFLELRRGQRLLLGALGLPLPKTSELQALDTPRALLAYLLDPLASHHRIDELSRAHADLMRHEVALVSAIGAGARELLDELSPKNLAPRGVGGVVSWLARLIGRDERWLALEQKIDELREESTLSSVVMGRGFVRAYAAALGKREGEGWPAPTHVPRAEEDLS